MTVWRKRKDALVLCSEKGPLLRHFEGLCGDLIGQQWMKGIQTVDLVQVRASTDRTGARSRTSHTTAVSCCYARMATAMHFTRNPYRRTRTGPRDRAVHYALSIPVLKDGLIAQNDEYY